MQKDMIIVFKLVFNNNYIKSKIVYFDSVDEAYKFYEIFKDKIVSKNIANKNVFIVKE